MAAAFAAAQAELANEGEHGFHRTELERRRGYDGQMSRSASQLLLVLVALLVAAFALRPCSDGCLDAEIAHNQATLANNTPMETKHIVRQRGVQLTGAEFVASSKIALERNRISGDIDLAGEGTGQITFTTKASTCSAAEATFEEILPNDTSISCRDRDTQRVLWLLVRDQPQPQLRPKRLPRLEASTTPAKFIDELMIGVTNHRFAGVELEGSGKNDIVVAAPQDTCDELEHAAEAALPNGAYLACRVDGEIVWKLERAQ